MLTSPKLSKKRDPRLHHNPNFKIRLPGSAGYHFPIGPSHNSPCIDTYWRVLGAQEVIQ